MNTPQRRHALSTWNELTAAEQKAVLLIAALFAMGVVARAWHLLRGN